jgi:hypothetical protein
MAKRLREEVSFPLSCVLHDRYTYWSALHGPHSHPSTLLFPTRYFGSVTHPPDPVPLSRSHTQTSLALDDVRRNLKRLATGTNNNKQSQQHTPISAPGFVSFPPTVANGNNEHEAPGGGVVNEHDDVSQILDQQLVEALERASSYSEANAILHRLHSSRQQRAMKRAAVEEEKRNGGGGGG